MNSYKTFSQYFRTFYYFKMFSLVVKCYFYHLAWISFENYSKSFIIKKYYISP